MKRLLTIATAVAALAACTKTAVVYEDAEAEIGLSPVSGMSTKTVYGPMGGETGSTYDTDEVFGIFAWHRVLNGQSAAWSVFKDGMTAANTALYIDNGRFGSKSVNGGTLWGGKDADGSDHPYYWPKTGVLAFAGYSPYDALDTDASAGEPKAESVDYDIDAANGGAAPKLTITGFSQGSYTNTSSNSVLSADNKTVDVMWFDADDQTALNLGTSGTASTSGVPVLFRHACSWIDFDLKASTDNGNAAYDKFRILKVTLKNVYTKGSFDSSKAGDTNTAGGDDVILSTSANPWSDFGFATDAVTDIVLYDGMAADGSYTEGDGITLNATSLKLGNLVAIPQDLDAVSAGTTAAAKNAATVEILYQQLTAAAGTVPNIETKTLTITGSNSSDVQGSTTSGDWLYGRHYTYTITFGLEEILIDPSVDNWEAGTGTAE